MAENGLCSTKKLSDGETKSLLICFKHESVSDGQHRRNTVIH